MSNIRPIDPERFAALLDGRLSPAEAAAVRAELARADEDDIGAFADAAAIAGDLRAERSSVIPLKPRKNQWLYIGAAAAGLIAVSVIGYRNATRVDPLAPDALVLAMAPEAHVPETPAWSIDRGGSPVGETRAQAIRLGAMLVDLELATRSADSSVALQATAISRLLADVPGATLTAREYADSAGSATRRRSLALSAARALGVPMANSGAALEAARAAAGASDGAFFTRNPFPATLDLLEQHAARTAADTAVVTVARDATRGGEISSIRQAATSLLQYFSR